MNSRNLYVLVASSAIAAGLLLVNGVRQEKTPVPTTALAHSSDAEAVSEPLVELADGENLNARQAEARSKAISAGGTNDKAEIEPAGVGIDEPAERTVEELARELVSLGEEFLSMRQQVVQDLIDRGLTVVTTEGQQPDGRLAPPGDTVDLMYVCVSTPKLRHLVEIHRHEQPRLFAINDKRDELRALIEFRQGYTESPSVRTFQNPR